MRPRGVVLHLSASTWGDRDAIDEWHRQRGFRMIGYHRVILNGRRESDSAYDASLDGIIQRGRPDDETGAHCLARGMNACTFGICCIGNPGTVPSGSSPADPSLVQRRYMTARQSASLIDGLARLCVRYDWNPTGTFTHPTTGQRVPVISQHSTHDPQDKPLCASLRVAAIRQAVAARIAAMDQGVRSLQDVAATVAPGEARMAGDSVLVSALTDATDDLERLDASLAEAEFELVADLSGEPDEHEDLDSDVPTDEVSAGGMYPITGIAADGGGSSSVLSDGPWQAVVGVAFKPGLEEDIVITIRSRKGSGSGG